MILGIETSCDDSAVALLDAQGQEIISTISSQTAVHQQYGGIVPELASRSHLVNLPLTLRYVMDQAHIQLKDLSCIAVTNRPGLIGSLLVGINFAKTLAWSANLPLIPVDHLEGHLLAPFLDNPELQFPYLALVASGGHTHLVVVHQLGKYTLLGKTLDDAAGEAFDKTAKMLGFQYPGGPLLEKITQNYPATKQIPFPIPLKDAKHGCNFSYSGLKTAVKNYAIEHDLYVTNQTLINWDDFTTMPCTEKKQTLINLVHSFQETMAESMIFKIKRALQKTQLKTLVFSGGVSANNFLRQAIQKLCSKKNIQFFYPQLQHCTDNAAMIAYTALQYWETDFINTLDLQLSAFSTTHWN